MAPPELNVKWILVFTRMTSLVRAADRERPCGAVGLNVKVDSGFTRMTTGSRGARGSW
jgi:hypothetical protein